MSHNKHTQNTIAEFDEFMAMLDTAKIPEGCSKEEAWTQLVQTIENKKQETKTASRTFPIRKILAVAASVLIIIGTWFTYSYTKTETVSTPNGQIATILLPDGSEVKLNAGSSISYKPYDFSNNRTVSLSGEAFFSVQKGTRFSVSYNKNNVTVLGTSFNIYARNTTFNVQCYSGKVKVETTALKGIILTKGKSIKTTENSNICNTETFNANDSVTWIKGEFYFANENLNTVFEEMERQFNIEITRPSMQTRLYTGYFSKTDLKTALDNVCLPMGIEYTMIDEKHITLK